MALRRNKSYLRPKLSVSDCGCLRKWNEYTNACKWLRIDWRSVFEWLLTYPYGLDSTGKPSAFVCEWFRNDFEF